MYDVKHGKLKRRQPAVAEIKSFRADELAEMGCICAWDGCTARTTAVSRRPAGAFSTSRKHTTEICSRVASQR